MITIDALWQDALHADWRYRTAMKHADAEKELWVKEMKQEADSLRFYGKDVSSDIQFKINSLQEIKIKEEREKEIEVQKQLERDKERKQELKQKYKEAETFEEQREARRELKKVFPQVYGGIKGSERRKGRGLALRYITGEIE